MYHNPPNKQQRRSKSEGAVDSSEHTALITTGAAEAGAHLFSSGRIYNDADAAAMTRTSATPEEVSTTKIQAIYRGRQTRSSISSILNAPSTALNASVAVLRTATAGVVDTGTQIVSSGVRVIGDSLEGAGEGAMHAFGLSHASRPLDTEVDAPTPEDRWFTPRHGWAAKNRKGGRPHLLMPTANDEEALFPLEKDVIGELRVEVLEAQGLPNMDATANPLDLIGNLTDAYAHVIFEGGAGRSSVVHNSLNPCWSASDPDSFRAFHFPVMKPYSVLYVSIHDYNDGRKRDMASAASIASGTQEKSARLVRGADDPIGRIAIQLCRLVAGCEYDCWFELGLGSIEKPNGSLGCIRVRFSVTFESERARMLNYVYGRTPSIHILPMHKRRYLKNASFAKRGALAKGKYDWDVLMFYVNELKDVARLVIRLLATVESILLWRGPWIRHSISNCVGFQILVSFPHFFPPSVGVLTLLMLFSTYGLHEEDDRLNQSIHQRPSFLQLCTALVLDKKPAPIKYSPPPAADRREAGRGLENIHTLTVAHWMEKILGGDSDVAKEQTWEYQQGVVRAEVATFIVEGGYSVEEGIAKEQQSSELQKEGGAMRIVFNPMATALGPVQRKLAILVPMVRQMKNALLWKDRILTFWITTAVVMVTFILALIPWGIVIFWSARILGVVASGPHMHFVGRHVDKERAGELEKAREYKDATEDRRDAMLQELRETLMKDARVQVEKAQLTHDIHSERAQRRTAFLKKPSIFNFVNRNTPANAHIKYIAAAELQRSKVGPLAATAAASSDTASPSAERGGSATDMV